MGLQLFSFAALAETARARAIVDRDHGVSLAVRVERSRIILVPHAGLGVDSHTLNAVTTTKIVCEPATQTIRRVRFDVRARRSA
jgi:hypothetical protein